MFRVVQNGWFVTITCLLLILATPFVAFSYFRQLFYEAMITGLSMILRVRVNTLISDIRSVANTQRLVV